MTEPLPELGIKVKADVQDAVDGLAEVEAAEKAFGKTSDDTTAKVKKNSKEKTTATTEFERLFAVSMKDAGKTLGDFGKDTQTETTKAKDAYTVLGEAIDTQREKIRNLQAQFKSGTGDSSTIFGDLTKAKSDLADMAKIANTVGADFSSAGDKAGKSFADGVGKAARVTKDELGKSGKDAGESFFSGLSETFAESSPQISAAAGAFLAPAIAAVIATGVTAGFGLGVIGIGAMALKDDPRVKSAANGVASAFGDALKTGATPLISPLVEGLNDLDGVAKDIAPDLKAMFTAAAPAAKAFIDGVGGFAEGAAPLFADAMKQAAPVVEKLGEDLPLLGQGLGIAIDQITKTPGLVDDMDIALKVLDGTITGLGVGVRILGTLFEPVTASFKLAGEAAGWISEKVHGAVSPTNDLAGATNNLDAYSQSLTTQNLTAVNVYAELALAIQNTKDQAAAYLVVEEKQLDLNMRLDTSLIGLKQSEDDLKASIKQNGNDWDINTQKGRNNETALLGVIQKNKDYLDAQIKLHGESPKLIAAYDAELKKELDLAKAHGDSAADVKALYDKYHLLYNQLMTLNGKKISFDVTGHYSSNQGGGVGVGYKASAGANSGVSGQLPHYDATGIYAGGAQPLYRFAEKSTVEEAVIARNGDNNRAISALRTAADWRGMDVVDRASRGGHGGGDVYIQHTTKLDSKVIARELIGPVQRANSRSSASIYGANA